MLALLCVWLGVGSLAYAIAIVLYRPLFTDPGVTATLYGAIFSLCFAGITLWDHRKDSTGAPAVQARRLQAWVGSVLSLLAISCIYILIARAQVVPRIPSEPLPASAPAAAR